MKWKKSSGETKKLIRRGWVCGIKEWMPWNCYPIINNEVGNGQQFLREPCKTAFAKVVNQ